IGLFELTEKAAAAGEHFYLLSQKLGIGAEQLSALEYAAKRTGASTEALATGLKKLEVSMVDGENPASKQHALFEALGISTDNLSKKDPAKIFEQLAAKIKEIPDPAERTKIAIELMGRSGNELLPTMLSNLSALTQQAKDMGKTWTDEETEKAHKFHEEMTKFGDAAGQAGREIGMAFIPPLTKALETVNDFIKALKQIPKEGSYALGIATGGSQGAGTGGSWGLGIATGGAKMPFGETLDTSLGKGLTATKTVDISGVQDALNETGKERLKEYEEGLKAIAADWNLESETYRKISDGFDKMAEEMLKDKEKGYKDSTEINKKELEDFIKMKDVMGQHDEDYWKARKVLQELNHRDTLVIDAERTKEDLKYWKQYFGLVLDTTTAIREFERQTYDLMMRGFGDAVGKMIVEGANFEDAMKALFQNVLEAFISMVAQMIAQAAILETLKLGFGIGPGLAGVGIPGLGLGVGGAGAGAGTASAGVGPTTAATNEAYAGTAGGAGATTGATGGGMTAADIIPPVLAAYLIYKDSPMMANLIEGNTGLFGGGSSGGTGKLAQSLGVPATPETLGKLYQGLFPGHADGGIATKASLAMIGEGGEPEAIVPLSKAAQFGFGSGGGNTYHVTLAFPNANVKDMSSSDWENILKANVIPALENLDRGGYQLPIISKSNR
ncbi:MAG TPA: hypothetical protein VN944_01970, partial [Nitrospiria bacterium]|nr:hypothetical protein [Nitrospiria bacterium]